MFYCATQKRLQHRTTSSSQDQSELRGLLWRPTPVKPQALSLCERRGRPVLLETTLIPCAKAARLALAGEQSRRAEGSRVGQNVPPHDGTAWGIGDHSIPPIGTSSCSAVPDTLYQTIGGLSMLWLPW